MADKDASKAEPKRAATKPAAAKPGAAKPAATPTPVHIDDDSIVERLRPHIKKIAIGAGVLVVAVIIGAVVVWFQSRGEIAKTTDVDRMLDVSRRPVRGKDDKPDPKQPSFANDKERDVAVLATPGATATETVWPSYRAARLLGAGRIDDAIATYKGCTADKALQGVLCREGMGYALEAKASGEKDPAARQKGLEAALTAFQAMQPDDAGPRYAYALYHQARLQLLLGKRDEAKKLFASAKTANKDGDRDLGDLLDKRLASLGAS